MIQIGNNQDLDQNKYDENRLIVRKPALYFQQEKVAIVSKNGMIKALSKGTATIYVYSISGSKTKIKVTVK